MNYLDIFQTIKDLKTTLKEKYSDLEYFNLLYKG